MLTAKISCIFCDLFELVVYFDEIVQLLQVSLSDKGKDGKYRIIFTGRSIECRLTDLRPNTEYHIRVSAIYEALKGGTSDTVSFVTDKCEPDQPAPPKLGNKSKTSICLRYAIITSHPMI